MQRALDVRIHIAVGRAIRIGNRNQRGQVKHNINVTSQLITEVGVAHISRNHFDFFEAANLFEPAPIVERVVLTQRPHARSGGDELFREMRTDEAVRSGYQHAGVVDARHPIFRIARSVSSTVSNGGTESHRAGGESTHQNALIASFIAAAKPSSSTAPQRFPATLPGTDAIRRSREEGYAESAKQYSE